MSRHRNVRSMDITDEYDEYEDVYGHSVEDDYCVSPSTAAFMYDRESSSQKISAYIKKVKDIAEEDEFDGDQQISNLSPSEKEKFDTNVAEIMSVLEFDVSKEDVENALLLNGLNKEQTVNYLLDKVGQQGNVPEKKLKVYTQQQPQQPIFTVDTDVPSVKVVASTGRSTVTKGFDVAQKDVARLTASPRSQSPASGRATPVNAVPEDELRKRKDNILAQYSKERGSSKEHLYMIVIGHVDAGKSTLMGHLLCKLGQVSQKTMHKYEQESRKLGKQSFVYAWVLDETGEERNRGITMDVGRFQFETKTKLVTLLDAPGHKDFIPNMISGAGQADVSLLVVDATRGEFETGFNQGGQTREHALLVRSLGVTQLAVAVNKLDTVGWSKERFDEIVQKMRQFLKQAGFRDSDVTFVPCSGLTGQNLVEKPTENELLSWYNGPCLLEVVDNFRSPERPVSKPFRFTINDIYKSTGSGFCVCGRVETGSLGAGDRVLICPTREVAVVKSLSIEEVSQQTIYAGDQASVTLSGVDMQNVSVGYVLCDPQVPVPIASKFQARIVVFNVTVPITKGFPVVLHHQSLVEPANISKLISQLNKSTAEVVKKHPRFLSNNTSAMVEIQVSRPIAVELYSDCKELGRFMLRVGGVTIAAGLITKIIL